MVQWKGKYDNAASYKAHAGKAKLKYLAKQISRSEVSGSINWVNLIDEPALRRAERLDQALIHHCSIQSKQTGFQFDFRKLFAYPNTYIKHEAIEDKRKCSWSWQHIEDVVIAIFSVFTCFQMVEKTPRLEYTLQTDGLSSDKGTYEAPR